MPRHYEYVKTAAEVDGEFYPCLVPLPMPGSGVEAYLAEMLQDNVLSTNTALANLIEGNDLDARQKATGRIRAAKTAAKSGKVGWATAVEYSKTLEVEQLLEWQKDPQGYTAAHIQKAKLGKAIPEAEAIILKAAYRARKAKSLKSVAEE